MPTSQAQRLGLEIIPMRGMRAVDASGNDLGVRGKVRLDGVLKSITGASVHLKLTVVVADRVTRCLLSTGQLIKSGFSVLHEPHLTKICRDNVEVALVRDGVRDVVKFRVKPSRSQESTTEEA